LGRRDGCGGGIAVTWFPQLADGAIAQFPAGRSRQWRTITNEMEDGTRVMLADSTAGRVGWSLEYQDLSDAEAQKLADLFAETRGSYGSFIFVDPFANLLICSEDLSQAAWQTGLLQVAPIGTTLPGGYRIWSLHNPTTGVQSLQQTVGLPGDYQCCFSAYIRSKTAGTVTVSRDTVSSQHAVGTGWTRIYLSCPGPSGATTSAFGVEIQPGQSFEIWGLQLEAQPYASIYKTNSTLTGIYEETSFSTDELNTQSDGPGRTSCSLVLTSRI
jgi:hypothetical protein